MICKQTDKWHTQSCLKVPLKFSFLSKAISHRGWPILRAAPPFSDKACSSLQQLCNGLSQFLPCYLRALQASLGREQLVKNKKVNVLLDQWSAREGLI